METLKRFKVKKYVSNNVKEIEFFSNFLPISDSMHLDSLDFSKPNNKDEDPGKH